MARNASRMHSPQLTLSLRAAPKWGGSRRGAGRKRGRRMPHATRAHFKKLPAHVTLRLREDAPSLRTVRVVRELERTFAAGCERPGFRLVHLLAAGQPRPFDRRGPGSRRASARHESDRRAAARAVNRVAKRMGPVLAERYHHRVLSSAEESPRGPPLRPAQCTAPRHYGPSGARARRPDSIRRRRRVGSTGGGGRYRPSRGAAARKSVPGRPRPQLALDDRMAAARLAGSRRRPRLTTEREQRSLDRG